MKTIRFDHFDQSGLYGCSEPGDQSGEYVKADAVRGLVSVIEELVRVKRAGVGKELMEAARKALEDVK
jgi:hypothetical protein